MSEPEPIDYKVLSELQDLMGDAYTTVYEAFIRSSEENIADLEGAVGQKNYTDIERITHTLKGSASNIGAKQLSKISEEVMESARQGIDTDYTTYMIKLKNEYLIVSAFIQDLLTN